MGGDAMGEESLRTIFLAHLDGGQAGRAMPEDLNEVLSGMVNLGRQAWPDLPVHPPLFVRHLAGAFTDVTEIGRALTTLHVADLYLACACTLGVKGAVERFETAHFASIGAFLHPIDSSAAFADEVRQRVRQKLFVVETAGAAPRIAEYSGRGQLSSWVGVVAQRTGLSLLRAERRHDHEEDALIDSISVGGDPDIELVRARYRAEFREAFQVAIAKLTKRDRMILRLHLVSGLSQQKIGAIYQVDQTTASRWIAKARSTIADEAQRYLHERSNINPSEFFSIAKLVISDLDLSLVRCFDQKNENDPPEEGEGVKDRKSD